MIKLFNQIILPCSDYRIIIHSIFPSLSNVENQKRVNDIKHVMGGMKGEKNIFGSDKVK